MTWLYVYLGIGLVFTIVGTREAQKRRHAADKPWLASDNVVAVMLPFIWLPAVVIATVISLTHRGKHE